ncbi:LysR family transcriptional regulator [Nonomuraea sp. NPDC050556]|uniref:LysR family transcriptional regulator n=1 Tax=Nonomuraea sp. NPDC050556 TaxID=3364369 RepID=UPI0037A25EE7
MPLPDQVSDLRPFDLLLSVARLGSLGAAAREHGISQPSASSRIATLERRLGLALLERSPQGSRLTAHGALVAGWARQACEAAGALDAGIASLLESADSRLTVAASLTAAEYLLPRWLTALRAQRPSLGLTLLAGSSGAVAAHVLAGEAELGFVEGVRTPAGLRGRTVMRDRLAVLVAPGHPWARRRSGITPAELAAAPLVARERGSGTREVLDKALGGTAEPLMELSSATAIKSAVAQGTGAAVLSVLAVAAELGAGTLVEVPVIGLDLTRPIRMIRLAGRALTGPARDLAALCR